MLSLKKKPLNAVSDQQFFLNLLNCCIGLWVCVPEWSPGLGPFCLVHITFFSFIILKNDSKSGTTQVKVCSYTKYWFFCSCFTGLYEHYPTNAEPECCDVRWEIPTDNQSKGTKKTRDSTLCHRTSLTASSASSLCNSRLKLCVLVLILLHTVLAVSAAQNSTDLGFENIRILGDRSPNEE